MRFIFTLLTIIITINLVNAQAFKWAERIGSQFEDISFSTAIDANANVYTTGSFKGTVDFDPGPGVYNMTSSGNADIFIQKLDSSGNFISAIRIGGYSFDIGRCIKLDGAGNIYIAGYFQSNVDFNPGPGTFNMISSGAYDTFILKLDNNGNFIWAKKMGGVENDYPESIMLDASNNIYTTGYFYSTADFDPGAAVFNLMATGVTADIYISKLDANGNFLWAKSFGSTGQDRAGAFTLDNQGNLYTIGSFQSVVDFDPGPGVFSLTAPGVSSNVFIQKLDINGNFLWAIGIGDVADDGYGSIIIDGAGNLVSTGQFGGTVDFDPGPGNYLMTATPGGGTPTDIFILKLDTNGNFISALRLGGKFNDGGGVIRVDAADNIFISGAFRDTVDFDPGVGVYNLIDNSGYSDIFIMKLNAAYDFVWAKSIGLPVNSHLLSTLWDNNDNVYLTGDFRGTVDFDPGAGVYNLNSNGINYPDGFTLKYNYCGITYNVNYNACDSIVLFGNTYNFNGNYIQQFSDIYGCDSSFNMHIEVHPTHDTTIFITACDSINIGGNTITASGIYIDPYITVWGCDSSVYMDVTIYSSSMSSIIQTACDSFVYNGQTYNTSGIYTQNYLNVNGCDSIITLNLTINQPTVYTINQSACVSHTLNGQTYNASGTYTQTLVNAAGCDSVITLNLTINQPTANTINQIACTSYTLNGQTYNASGIYTQTLVNAAGCDSVITLNLTINQPSANTITQTACNSYTLNGQTYNTTGTYTQTLVNAVNCDSVITLNLTINTVNTAVTQTGALMTANASPATYQWLRCNPYQGLPGETNQSYTAGANGDYAVAVTQNGCTDTSNCHTVIGIGIDDYVKASNIILYPNPVSQKLVVENEKAFQHASIRVLTVAGQIMIEENNIFAKRITLDMSKLTSGIYFIEIEDDGYKFVRPVTKD